MKKVNFKTVLMALFVAFAFLFVGVNGADAQTISGSGNSVYAVPQGDFVSANDAMSILDEAKMDVKALGAGAAPAVLVVLEAQITYYEGIGTSIESGSTVAKAVVDALSVVAPDNLGGVSEAQMSTFKQEAVDLLSL